LFAPNASLILMHICWCHWTNKRTPYWHTFVVLQVVHVCVCCYSDESVWKDTGWTFM